jgi:hypothetical protein
MVAQFAGLLVLGGLEQTGAQHDQRLGAVLDLALLVLHGHDDAGRQVGDAHGRVGRVHALPAGTGGTVDVDLEVVGSMSTSTSSASGSTETVAEEVWTRPLASVTGTRWTRCTPASCSSRTQASSPRIR